MGEGAGVGEGEGEGEVVGGERSSEVGELCGTGHMGVCGMQPKVRKGEADSCGVKRVHLLPLMLFQHGSARDDCVEVVRV